MLDSDHPLDAGSESVESMNEYSHLAALRMPTSAIETLLQRRTADGTGNDIAFLGDCIADIRCDRTGAESHGEGLLYTLRYR